MSINGPMVANAIFCHKAAHLLLVGELAILDRISEDSSDLST